MTYKNVIPKLLFITENILLVNTQRYVDVSTRDMQYYFAPEYRLISNSHNYNFQTRLMKLCPTIVRLIITVITMIGWFLPVSVRIVNKCVYAIHFNSEIDTIIFY